MDDLPPLDDMSDLIENIKSKNLSKTTTPHESNDIGKSDKASQETKNCLSVKKEKFGGFSKGFLFNKKNSRNSVLNNSGKSINKTENKEDFHVKVRPENNPLILNEVQNAINHDSLLNSNNKEWLTDDLLTNINKNEDLMERLSDPKYTKAVEWMQKDPKAAMEYYKNDSEVQQFFKEFYNILGGHFSKLGNKQEIVEPEHHIKSEDELKMESILNNPEIREVLAKPKIKELFSLLKTNPDKAQLVLNKEGAGFRADIQKLVHAGLLNFESN